MFQPVKLDRYLPTYLQKFILASSICLQAKIPAISPCVARIAEHPRALFIKDHELRLSLVGDHLLDASELVALHPERCDLRIVVDVHLRLSELHTLLRRRRNVPRELTAEL